MNIKKHIEFYNPHNGKLLFKLLTNTDLSLSLARFRNFASYCIANMESKKLEFLIFDYTFGELQSRVSKAPDKTFHKKFTPCYYIDKFILADYRRSFVENGESNLLYDTLFKLMEDNSLAEIIIIREVLDDSERKTS